MGSNPSRATVNAFGRAVGRQAVCKAAALVAMWVRFPPEALRKRGTRNAECGTNAEELGFHSAFRTPNSALPDEARWSNGLRHQVVNLKTRVQLPYEPLLMVVMCYRRPVRLAA